ncbi:hypothetical protein LguiB_005480 [Lonicera macranthoides]
MGLYLSFPVWIKKVRLPCKYICFENALNFLCCTSVHVLKKKVKLFNLKQTIADL